MPALSLRPAERRIVEGEHHSPQNRFFSDSPTASGSAVPIPANRKGHPPGSGSRGAGVVCSQPSCLQVVTSLGLPSLRSGTPGATAPSKTHLWRVRCGPGRWGRLQTHGQSLEGAKRWHAKGRKARRRPPSAEVARVARSAQARAPRALRSGRSAVNDMVPAGASAPATRWPANPTRRL